MSELKQTTKKISDSYRNKCLVHDLKTVTGDDDRLASYPSIVDGSFTEIINNRAEVDFFGNITKIDCKSVHKFPWCSFFVLEGEPDFEEYKNGLTEAWMIKHHGLSSWKAMELADPGCCKQSDEEKQEVIDYWKKWRQDSDDDQKNRMPALWQRRSGRFDTWGEDFPSQDQVEPSQCLSPASTGIETKGSTAQDQRVKTSRRFNPAAFFVATIALNSKWRQLYRRANRRQSRRE